MHLLTLKSPISCNISSPKSHFAPNPRLMNPCFPPICTKIGAISKGIDVSVSRSCFSLLNKLVEDGNLRRSFVAKKADIATLGNMCVDVVLNVPSLPPPEVEERKAYMDRLSASQPDKKYWEAGGNCNAVIAAARIGLHCLTLGHVGSEIYGSFLLDVLNDEGIGMVGMCDDSDVLTGSASYETLLCWVLVDPLHRHGFCSRADFSDDPAFNWLSKLSERVKMAIEQSKILFCNGYAFEEFSPGLLTSALEYAIEVETSIFFDPGPRGRTLSIGTPEQQRALDQYLRMSDVLLLTSDEAESLTGITNPVLAGEELLKKGERTKWVIVKMGSKGSILITASSISCVPAFKVNVTDTVGCGDSFVAAIAIGYLHGLPAVNTLTLGNAVGAATAMGCGAGRNVANLEKVIEILKASNLNNGDLLSMFIDENLELPEIISVTKNFINGVTARADHVSLQEIVSDLLPILEFVHENRVAMSSRKAMDVQCISEGS